MRAEVGRGPRHLAVNKKNNYVYVPNQTDNTVSILKFPRIYQTISDKSFNVPQFVAYNPSREEIYVANYGTYPNDIGNTISVIKDTQVVDVIQVGNGPVGIEYDPEMDLMFVTNEFSNDVSVIKASNNNLIRTLQVGYGPMGIAYNPIDKYMYVTNFLSGTPTESPTISVLKPDRRVRDIEVDRLACAIDYSPKFKKMYVTIDHDIITRPGTPYRILQIDADDSSDTYQQVLEPITPDGLIRPRGISFNPRDNNMYVTNFEGNYVSVIRDMELIDSVHVEGNGSWGIAYYKDTEKMLVVNQGSNDVYMLP